MRERIKNNYMDNNEEKEKIQKLVAFRQEIKKFVDEAHELEQAGKYYDATVAKIEDVGDLDIFEMEAWDEFKRLLSYLHDDLIKKEGLTMEDLDNFLIEIGKLSSITTGRVDDVDNISRKALYNWMNNRLSGIINYVELFKNDVEDGVPFKQSNIESIGENYTRFVKGEK